MARPEQTEKPTPKKKQDARNKGQVARSADLSNALTFLTTVLILHATFFNIFDRFGGGLRWALEHSAIHEDLTIKDALTPYIGWVGSAITPIVILLLSVITVGVLTGLAMAGLHFTLKPLTPNFGKLNPLAGIKRLFSPQTIVTLAKQLIKMSIVIMLVYDSLHDSLITMLALAEAPPFTLIATVEGQLYSLAMHFGSFLLVLGVADYFWERKRLEDSLKMSKHEVRDEARQQEASGEIKKHVRRRQREIARRRMMNAVPKATVVVTNPTHFAVALRWDEATMDAPIVVAKGADLIAKKIREVAREHQVPIVENPPLARSLYRDVPLESAVPVELYAAVAKIIAFVFALKSRPTGAAQPLRPPPFIPVPHIPMRPGL